MGVGPARQRVAAGKDGHFMAIAAAGHRAPYPAFCARGIVKKQTASWIGADAEPGIFTLGDNFGARTCDGRKEPIQAIFAGNEFQPPPAVLPKKFVVALGDTQHFVDGFD